LIIWSAIHLRTCSWLLKHMVTTLMMRTNRFVIVMVIVHFCRHCEKNACDSFKCDVDTWCKSNESSKDVNCSLLQALWKKYL
jgi:hypothetical protein